VRAACYQYLFQVGAPFEKAAVLCILDLKHLRGEESALEERRVD
jgi:hypothetical protein